MPKLQCGYKGRVIYSIKKMAQSKCFTEEVMFEHFKKERGFHGGAVIENLPANAGDTGSSPGLGRSHTPRSN